jgi:hypothetical protein
MARTATVVVSGLVAVLIAVLVILFLILWTRKSASCKGK